MLRISKNTNKISSINWYTKEEVDSNLEMAAINLKILD
jgi:hypothetical protein